MKNANGRRRQSYRFIIPALAMFLLLVMPAHAWPTFVAGSFWAPGPVFVNQPTFAAVSMFMPGPVITQSPVFAAAAISRPPLIVQNTPVAIGVAVNQPPLVVQETTASINVAVNAPQVSMQPTQLPSVGFATNFRPQFGPSPTISISFARRELPTMPSCEWPSIRLSTLEERYPCPAAECECEPECDEYAEI
jgi:hypothetical protein